MVLAVPAETGRHGWTALTEGNIAYQVDAVAQVFSLGEYPVLAAVLPPHTNAGVVVCHWLPLVLGLRCVYPGSVEGAVRLAGSIAPPRGVVLVADPRQLRRSPDAAAAERLTGIEMVITGHGRIVENIGARFQETTGIPVMQGYFPSEAGPVVSFNKPDRDDRGTIQRSSKPGTVGHPLPGTAVRIVNPVDGAILGPGEEGQVQIKSPGVAPELVNRSPGSGWVPTDHLGRLDEDGFLSLSPSAR